MFCPNPDCPHREETGRAAEFRAGIERCSDCGTALVDEDPFAAEAARSARHIEMVELTELTEPALAATLAAMLDEAGIGYEIEGGGVQDFFGVGRLGTGFSPITGAPQLRVDATRLAEAHDLLAALLASPPPPDPSSGEET
jgi:hypothetical protein